MRTPGNLGRWIGLIGTVALLYPASPVLAQSANTHRTNLIVISTDASRPTAGPVLQLIRRRLPVGVHPGRFVAAEGESSFCIFSRLRTSSITALPTRGGEMLPACWMIPVFVDGRAIPNPGSFLAGARASDLESIELVSDVDAKTRFGISDEVLVLWTRGRGPHARGGNPGL